MVIRIEGTLTIDPAKHELEKRIEELLEDEAHVDDEDRREARHEAIREIVFEELGYTGLDIDLIEEEK